MEINDILIFGFKSMAPVICFGLLVTVTTSYIVTYLRDR